LPNFSIGILLDFWAIALTEMKRCYSMNICPTEA
jgi:hypothetical protein